MDCEKPLTLITMNSEKEVHFLGWVVFFFHFIFLKHTRRPANQSQHSTVRTSKGFSEIFVSTQHPCITRGNKRPNLGSGKQSLNATYPLILQPHLPLSWIHSQMALKMSGIWHFNYRSPAARPGEVSLKNKREQLKEKKDRLVSNSPSPQMARGKQEQGTERMTGQLKLFFWPGWCWHQAQISFSWHLLWVLWHLPSEEKHLLQPHWASSGLQLALAL